jgi:hypothetical protein
MLACDILAGRLTVELTEPKLTVCEKSSRLSTKRAETATEPVSKAMTAPAPLACRKCASLPGCSGSPG